jgi:hypothetical protein
MWVMTATGGFYSAIRKPDMPQDQIMVRGRRKDDLERLLKAVGSKTEIVETPRADYRFRVIIPTAVWAQYLSEAAMSVDYSNFKDVACVGDHARHAAYMNCWVALLGLQDGRYRR